MIWSWSYLSSISSPWSLHFNCFVKQIRRASPFLTDGSNKNTGGLELQMENLSTGVVWLTVQLIQTPVNETASCKHPYWPLQDFSLLFYVRKCHFTSNIGVSLKKIKVEFKPTGTIFLLLMSQGKRAVFVSTHQAPSCPSTFSRSLCLFCPLCQFVTNRSPYAWHWHFQMCSGHLSSCPLSTATFRLLWFTVWWWLYQTSITTSFLHGFTSFSLSPPSCWKTLTCSMRLKISKWRGRDGVIMPYRWHWNYWFLKSLLRSFILRSTLMWFWLDL